MTSVAAIGDSGRTVVGQGFSAMTSDEFAKIIFAELSRQDPLAPNDTNALIEQISGIRSIQSNMDLTNKLQSLVAQNEFAGAATLLGRRATGLTDDGRRATGIVASVTQAREGARVVLRDGTTMRISSLERVETEEGGTP